jgi:hypothetical protein
MTTVGIRQFRAALASRTEQGALVRAYRELARRPALAAGMLHTEWNLWSDVGTPATHA